MRARWGWLAAALLCGSAAAAPLTPPFGFPPGEFQNRAAIDASSASAACSQLTYLSIDGCTGAPAYVNSTLSFQDTALLTAGHAFQSGQAINISGVNWNVAGKDFPVGNTGKVYCNNSIQYLHCSTTPGATNLIDASQYDWADAPNDVLHVGCTSVSIVASRMVWCHLANLYPSPNVVNINGFDWTPPSGCLSLYVQETATNNGTQFGTINFNDNYWKMGNSTQCVAPSETTQPIQLLQPSPASNDVFTVNANNNVLDQQASQILSYGLASPPLSPPGIIGVANGGPISFKYNLTQNIIAQAFRIQNSCGGLNVDFNVVHNMGYQPSFGHGDLLLRYVSPLCMGGSAFYNVHNNTFWEDASLEGPAVTSPFNSGGILSDNSGGTTFNNIDIQLNTLIPNQLDHYAINNATPTVCTSGCPDAQSGSYAVNDVVQITGPSCALAPTIMVTSIDGSSHVTGIKPWTGGECSSAPSSSTWWRTTCLSGACVAGSGAGLDVRAAWVNYMSGFGIFVAGGSGFQSDFVNLNISNNAIYPYGLSAASNALHVSVGASGASCSGTVTWSGNFSLYNNSAISPTYDAGGSGC